MGNLIGLFFNFISGGLVDKIFSFLGDREKRKYDAMNDQQKLEYEDKKDARATALAVRDATATFWEMRLITFLIAFIFTLHVVLVGLDTCFTFGWRIPKWPAPMDDWEAAIILSFFGVSVIGSAIRSNAAKSVIVAREATRAKRTSVLDMMKDRG